MCAHTLEVCRYTQAEFLAQGCMEEHACHYKACLYIFKQIWESLELCNLHNLKFDSQAFLVKKA